MTLVLLNKQVGVPSQSEGVGNRNCFVGAHAFHHTLNMMLYEYICSLILFYGLRMSKKISKDF